MTTAAQRLVEAETAYHALMLGKSAVEVRDSSGEMVVYQRASASSLMAYIAKLKLEIAGASSTRGPLGVYF